MPERQGVVGSTLLPRPTRAALCLFAAAVGLELLGRLLGSRGMTLVAAGGLGTLVAAAVLTPRISGVTVSLETRARMTAGTESMVGLRLAAPVRRGWRAGPFLVTDGSAAYDGTTVMVPALRSGGSSLTRYPVRPGRRGHWQQAVLTVEGVSPLGGFVRRRRVALPAQTWVHPAPALPLSLSLPSAAVQDLGGASRRRLSPTGAEIAGLREWQAGDATARVHWRASARRDQLVVMERDDEQRVVALVAVGRTEVSARWERAVARCAATALGVLRSGGAVVMLAADSDATATSARDLLDGFATIEHAAPVATTSLARALSRSGPGAVVLWLAAEPVSPEVSGAVRAAGGVLVPVPLSGERDDR